MARSRPAPTRRRCTAPSRPSGASAASTWRDRAPRPTCRQPTARPAASDPDFFPMTVLTTILTGASGMNLFAASPPNRSSRLYRALVETGLAASVSGSLSPMLDPYLYSIVGHGAGRAGRLDEVEAALDAEMERVAGTSRSRRQNWRRPSNRPRPSLPIRARASPTRASGWAIRPVVADTGLVRVVSRTSWRRSPSRMCSAWHRPTCRRRNRTVGHYLPEAAVGGVCTMTLSLPFPRNHHPRRAAQRHHRPGLRELTAARRWWSAAICGPAPSAKRPSRPAWPASPPAC